MKQYYRNIIFSRTPLTTRFHFKEQFQIFPCIFEKAPISKITGIFPIVLEYWIDDSESIEVPEEFKTVKKYISTLNRRSFKVEKIVRLLTAITNHKFFSHSGEGIKWGIPIPDEVTDANKDEIDNQSSQPFLSIYSYPNLFKDLYITNFTEQNFADPRLIDHKIYYVYDPIDSKEKEITFPHTIFNILGKYYSLDTKSKDIIDTVTHLIYNGIELFDKMKSVSFLVFVSAIETLINYEYRNDKPQIEFECKDCQTLKNSPVKCQKCGRPIWGVNANFRNFLKTYVASSEESIKKFKRIYNLRSKIVHTGLLLLGDEHENWVKSEKQDEQWKTHLETMQAARIGLVNWLIQGPNKVPR